MLIVGEMLHIESVDVDENENIETEEDENQTEILLDDLQYALALPIIRKFSILKNCNSKNGT